jgi:putative ABC transport system permease protein
VGVEIALGLKEVKEARPLLFGTRTLDALGGKREAIQVIGVQYPYELGGPWNFVVADKSVLSEPDTLILENSMRQTYGNLNPREIRELGGRRIVAGGFTRGLLPFGPAYSFADFELARELLAMPRDKTNFVLIKLNNPQDIDQVQNKLKAQLPETDVLSQSELSQVLIKYLLTATPIGVTFGAISFFGILVGTVIVSLTMFQTVADNLKEFGTLKAIGANMSDLTILMYTQAVLNAWIGSLFGVTVVGALASFMRNPKLALYLPLPLTIGTFLVMTAVCFLAASIALLKLRKVEPGMVFR